jgi:hypothetical protein
MFCPEPSGRFWPAAARVDEIIGPQSTSRRAWPAAGPLGTFRSTVVANSAARRFATRPTDFGVRPEVIAAPDLRRHGNQNAMPLASNPNLAVASSSVVTSLPSQAKIGAAWGGR